MIILNQGKFVKTKKVQTLATNEAADGFWFYTEDTLEWHQIALTLQLLYKHKLTTK